MTAQRTVLQNAPGTRSANTSSAVRTCAGDAALQQQRPAGAAQLAHHRRRAQAAADDVADDDAVAAVGQVDDVVPVAADLERVRGRLVVGGEPGRQRGRPQHGSLEGDGHLAEEPHPRALDGGAFVGPLPLGLDRPRVGDRGGDLAGDQIEEHGVLLVQRQPGAGTDDQRAHRAPPAGERERQGDGGVDVDPAERAGGQPDDVGVPPRQTGRR